MNINLTLIGQTITFFVFVWFCAKFVWPALIGVMQEREKKIADGLQAAERADKDLELAHKKAGEQLREAKEQAAEIIEQANKRATQIVDEAKDQAKAEADRLITAAKAEIEQEANRAKEELRGSVATLAIAGAEKILEQEIDPKSHNDLVSKLASQL
ncbi:F0F1 ATP synthase subunit B [Candidatus Endobugula sertula]|uniref:ATP synthase subunit b n=1 Tax=Candidatus Endobugula sertula TaxID=62101 RepID=A0A1D2QNJ9_9GAMM|nr:F0F1 ATP synthase subunit B [Candidatus Endobugula sertula]